MRIRPILLAAILLTGPAFAEDAVKKTGEGVGNVFKGVGQAAKRTVDNIYIAPKKGEKKAEKKQ